MWAKTGGADALTELIPMIIHVLDIIVIGMCIYDQYVLSGRVIELEDEVKRLKYRVNGR